MLRNDFSLSSSKSLQASPSILTPPSSLRICAAAVSGMAKMASGFKSAIWPAVSISCGTASGTPVQRKSANDPSSL